MKTSQTIQIYKTITWSIISIVVTTTVGWIVTGSFALGFTVGIISRIIKVGIYYAHERYWHKRYKLAKKIKGLE